MRFIEVIGETNDLKRYDPCVFAVIDDFGKTRIFSQTRELGTFERSDMTLEKLEEHLEQLEKQGFTVRELKHIYS